MLDVKASLMVAEVLGKIFETVPEISSKSCVHSSLGFGSKLHSHFLKLWVKVKDYSQLSEFGVS